MAKATLTLDENNGKFEITSMEGDISFNTTDKNNPITPDQELIDIMKPYHDKVVKYMETVIGKSNVELNSRLSRYTDTSLFQLIADAQKWGVEVLYKDMAGEALKNPILSMVAPFLTGAGGVDDYTMIEPGDITLGGTGSITYMMISFKELR